MNEAISYIRNEDLSERLIPVQRDPTILTRIAEFDETAVNDCVIAYGSLVWALAKKLLGSEEEAAKVTREIFLDLWRQTGQFDPVKCCERDFVFSVAYRVLAKRRSENLAAS